MLCIKKIPKCNSWKNLAKTQLFLKFGNKHKNLDQIKK